jgi:hypothetical protein
VRDLCCFPLCADVESSWKYYFLKNLIAVLDNSVCDRYCVVLESIIGSFCV